MSKLHDYLKIKAKAINPSRININSEIEILLQSQSFETNVELNKDEKEILSSSVKKLRSLAYPLIGYEREEYIPKLNGHEEIEIIIPYSNGVLETTDFELGDSLISYLGVNENGKIREYHAYEM